MWRTSRRSMSRQPSSSAYWCPARGRRAKGGPTGRRQGDRLRRPWTNTHSPGIAACRGRREQSGQGAVIPAGAGTVPGLEQVQGIGLPVRVLGVERDRQEFAEFYAAACDDCLRVVLISVGDRQLAEDLVAEAFTRAWTACRKVGQHPAP